MLSMSERKMIKTCIFESYKNLSHHYEEQALDALIDECLISYHASLGLSPVFYCIFEIDHILTHRLCQNEEADSLLFFHQRYHQLGLYIAKKLTTKDPEKFYEEMLLETMSHYDGKQMFSLQMMEHGRNLLHPQISQQEVSTHATVSSPRKTAVQENLPENHIVSTSDSVQVDQETLKSLPMLESFILSLYLGYINDKKYTVEQLASFFELSEETVLNMMAKNLERDQKRLKKQR